MTPQAAIGALPVEPVACEPCGDLNGFTVAAHTKKEIVAAGEALRGYLPYPITDETLNVFRTAHEWRLSHLQPMRRMRAALSAHVSRTGGSKGLTAARLKRLTSVRKKLRTQPRTLFQLQDLGGCRAIVSTPADLETVASRVRDLAGDIRFQRESDYITAPKADGYRGRHLIVSVEGDDHRRLIEVQVRSGLQHAWATAVEVVGLMRGEDLKGGAGDPDWRRLFVLMAAEFAREEHGPMPPGVDADDSARRGELRDVSGRLKALIRLEGYNEALGRVSGIRGAAGQAFLVSIDLRTHDVTVRTNPHFARTAEQLFTSETAVAEGQRDTVSVEVDRVADLQAAFPNYFLDARSFTERLRRLTGTEPVDGVGKWASVLRTLRLGGR